MGAIMKHKIFILILIMIPLLSLQAEEEVKLYEEYNKIETKYVTFYYKEAAIQNKEKQTIEILDIVLVAKTKGWVSIGFNPKRRMQGADYIIGYVTDKGEVVIADHYGHSMIGHKSDLDLKGEDNIIDPTGSIKDGITTLKFKIPRNSGDKNDTVLSKGKHSLLFGIGMKNDLKSKHIWYTKKSFELK